MKYSVCSETVFEGVDILDAMKTIKKCGYDAVEFWFWWERDVDAIAKASRELNLEVAAICAPLESRETYRPMTVMLLICKNL